MTASQIIACRLLAFILNIALLFIAHLLNPKTTLMKSLTYLNS